MRMEQADNRKKRVLLTPKAYAARGSVQEYMENLNRCLVREIPEGSLEGIESTLQTILDNIQQETLSETLSSRPFLRCWRWWRSFWSPL